MADEADLADRDSADFLDRALKLHREREKEVSIVLSGVKICTECGDSIAKERAALPFVVRCIDCQRELEESEKRYPH